MICVEFKRGTDVIEEGPGLLGWSLQEGNKGGSGHSVVGSDIQLCGSKEIRLREICIVLYR